MHHVGDEANWNVLFQRFVAETDSSEKLKLMIGLAGIRSSWILSELVSQQSVYNSLRIFFFSFEIEYLFVLFLRLIPF